MVNVASFLSSIGVNTHMDATAAGYGEITLVANALAYLGVKAIRDHAYDIDIPAYQVLGAAGVRLDLIVDTDTQHEVATMLPVTPHISSFEGSNEVDYWTVTMPGVTGPVASAIAAQKVLYAVVHANPAIAKIPIWNESLAFATDYTKYAGSLTYATVANAHLYSGNGDTPQTYIVPTLQAEIVTTGKLTVVTETGYYTLPNNPTDPSGVDESIQARLTLDTLFDNFKLGVPQTYLYELLDEGPDALSNNRELHYGLFHADGSPKLAAKALHNLTSILGAQGVVSGGVIATTPTVTGLPATGNWMTMAGPNGTEFTAVWAEPNVWDQATQHELPATPTTVTVDLGALVASVTVYDPLAGTAPIAILTNTRRVVLNLTDHPLIIQAAPAANPLLPAPIPVPPINIATVSWTNSTTGASGRDATSTYSGGVSGLASQYRWTMADNVVLSADKANASLTGGAGTDALKAIAGSNILDGGAGSSFLVGATGADGGIDQFFVDGRGTSPTWSTIVHFHYGDQVTLWGFQGGLSTLAWAASEGAAGYTGATLHSALAVAGTGVNASLTLAGLTLADTAGRLTATTGTLGQANYLRLSYTG